MSDMTSTIMPSHKRIFFGLWPSLETAAALMNWVRQAHAVCGGRMMTPETLHLTLAFLGQVPSDVADSLAQQARHWQAPVGRIDLQRFGRFEGPRIVWAGPGRSDNERLPWLDALHDALWRRLAPYGFEPEHAVFRPHVSLLRRAGPGDLSTLACPPLVWRPARCVLVESRPSHEASRYQVLAQLPLSFCD